ncbi:hypothetical protein BDR26DRAFT_139943 [Obelidium mucronatum]|nr:hypothetical protein BDR26DRAFT_139943 [Obelidium mucronatum]
MKLILKYASISGMSFNVQELNEIILKSNETLPYDKTHLGIIQIIETSDVYQFVKKTDMKDVYCFSHFLIQQGILSTMVPSKREEIHSVYADYFLKKMNKSANKWENIQAVVYHLFQVTGQEERKQITLYTAFLESAEMGMISEAFEFYEALQDFENKLELARNVYEAIREHRLLAYIHLGKGHMVESMEHCRAGLALAGQPITSNNIIAATRFAKMFRAASQILASKDEAKQISVSASFVKSTFSKAFQPNNPTTNAIRASIASRRGSRRTSRINSNSHDLNWKVIDEIVQTLRLRQKMTPPSFELIEMQGVCLILGVKLMKERELAVASYFAEFSTSLNLLGFDKLSQIASARCQQLVDDFKETNGPDYVPTDEEDKSIAAIFKSQGQHHWKNGKWNEAAALIKSAEELLSNRGRGFSDDCYLARNDAANLYLIGGNFFRCKALVEDDMKFHLTDEYEELNAEFYFRQAALAAEEGVFESAERWYNQALELYSVSQDDSLRTLACMSNALRAAIMILHGVDGDEGSTKYLLGRISMHLETCLEKTEEIEPLQVPLAARIWITILLLLIELHTNLGQNTVLKSNLATSIRAITVQIQKTNKPNLLKPLTPLNALCRCIAHGIGFLWLEKSNIVGFESSIRKGISQVEGGSSLMDKQLKRAILVRLWRVQAVSGNANCKTESWIAEGKGHMKSFETDGFIYEGELLRAALNHVNPNFI